MVTAAGTSSVGGRAAETTTQQTWTCALMHPSPSHVGPQQHRGRHGAPGLNINKSRRGEGGEGLCERQCGINGHIGFLHENYENPQNGINE